MIEDVSVSRSKNCYVCIVHNLSDELKEIIRANLASICHGPARVSEVPEVFNYKNTLKEFFEVFDASQEPTQVGMMGELLAHLLIGKKIKKLKPLSLYLNQEERSIKKGFDILYGESNKLWVAEIKSGKKGSLTEVQKHRCLIKDAKSDLNSRLNEDIIARWRGALAGLDILRKKKSEKKKLQDILQKKYLDATKGKSQSTNVSVILVSVLFDGAKTVKPKDITTVISSIEAEKIFKELIAFLIQKKTLKKLEEFLRGQI